MSDAPIQYMARVSPFITSIITGLISAITLPVNSWVLVKSSFTLLNFACW